MSKTSWTLKELLDAEVEPDPEVEEAFRRGYLCGMAHTLDAIEAGATLAQATAHYYDELLSWIGNESFYDEVPLIEICGALRGVSQKCEKR